MFLVEGPTEIPAMLDKRLPLDKVGDTQEGP